MAWRAWGLIQPTASEGKKKGRRENEFQFLPLRFNYERGAEEGRGNSFERNWGEPFVERDSARCERRIEKWGERSLSIPPLKQKNGKNLRNGRGSELTSRKKKGGSAKNENILSSNLEQGQTRL